MTNKYNTLYTEVIKLVNQSLEAVLKKASVTNGNLDLEGAISNSKALLDDFRNKTNEDIRDLQELVELDTFTIAFYGETNAGKSTLIETLRILLRNEEKLVTQEKFKTLAKDLRVDSDSLAALEKSIQLLELQLTESQGQAELLKQKLQGEEQQQNAKLEALKATIQHKRKNLSLWHKLVFLFKKLDEENSLSEHELQLVQLRASNKVKLEAAAANLGKASAELNARRSELAQVEKSFAQLVPLQDGHIIGNGHSDFTRQSQAYRFTVNGQKFQLIDVPGIEGDEKQVMSAIETSVKTAHAVFYVTRSAQPPGSGSEGQDGTIHKIKRQLGKQTEVWAIYNKSATNPQVLKSKTLINENDAIGLADMRKSLTKTLGADTYKGHICVSGLPAFLASASCLVPNNPHVNSRNKFLKVMNEKEILSLSGMDEFLNFIRDEICQNFQKKINNANLKKIRDCLQGGINKLEQASGHFNKAAAKLKSQQESDSAKFKELITGTSQKLKSECHDQLNKKKSDMRSDIYEYISTDKSNDDFKEYLTAEFEELKISVGKDLEVRFIKVFEIFKWEASKIIEQNQKNVDDILHYTIDNPFSSSKLSFNTNFKMDKGINVLGLISTLGGAAGLVWTTFLASNPAGWTVAAVLGAVGLVFSFYKAIRSFLSSDYKKEQQRKSADNNLNKVFAKLTERLDDNLESASAKINEALMDTQKQMRIPYEQCVNTKTALEGFAARMKALHDKLIPKQTPAATTVNKAAAAGSTTA
ncbi:MAG: hypothetical protein RLY71_3538 [Pseudomonadota bacterium]|jgi:energy-coupling factor transporter ATP-binding protein EcfA2